MTRSAAILALVCAMTSPGSAGEIVILSDSSWKSTNSVVDTGSCPYDGGAVPAWTEVGFDDGLWRNAYAPYPPHPTPWPPFPGTLDFWIWDWPGPGTPSGLNGPNDTFYRRTFTLDAPVISAEAKLWVDDNLQLYVNGQWVAEDVDGGAGAKLSTDITPYLMLGDNVVAVRAWDGGPACAISNRLYEHLAVVVTIFHKDVLPVEIDIKPGSDPNSINLGSHGAVPVAILSTLDFDATTVDPESVELAGAGVRLKGKGTPMASYEDVNNDGATDLVVHISTDALELTDTDEEALLVGETYDGLYIIRGYDFVRIVP
jgi:hypothetical protein